MSPGHRDAFPATRHSVVRAIADPNPEARREAYGALIRGYWRPVYTYIRLRWHRDSADAQDLTQEFFARAFEKEYLARYDPARARFRTFIRTCLDAFLANEQQTANRLKRGGGIVIEPLDFASVDGDLARQLPGNEPDPEIWFRREWIRSLFADALDELRRRCDREGRERAFVAFQKYDVDGSDDGRRPTYAALARGLGTSTTDVTNQLVWARRMFREIVLDLLRTVCATEREFQAEARDVLGISEP
jgi:RNA polymerase sigma factor (sigma-70 family)